MCAVLPTLLGKAVGGRTGAIIGGGLSGGIPGALVASQLFKNKKPDAQPASVPTYGG
jgi:outer membrane lipoprotein SlyB